MAKSPPQRLKLYTEQPPAAFDPCLEADGSLGRLCRAFQQATGWNLQYVPDAAPCARTPKSKGRQSRRQASGRSKPTRWSAPVSPGKGTSLGHLRLDLPDAAAESGIETADPQAAQELAASVAGLLGELARARHALWLREAELAAAVPVVPHPCEQAHLADRLEAVLRAGAEAVGFQAAGLYVLDEGTTRLKLRSCWGLPRERFEAPARPLRDAVADLEALLGHAVVLSDPTLLQAWRSPEQFPTAVCLPVSSPTTLFGTLWFLSTERRDLSARETGVLEVVAGRVAAELEREVLLAEAWQTHRLTSQLAAAQRLHRNQLPAVPPLADGWHLAGGVFGHEGLGGALFDWYTLPDGLLAFTVARTTGTDMEAALSAAGLRTALRAHARYHREPAAWLRQVNMTMWTGSAGDFRAEGFCGLAETTTGRIGFAAAGPVAGLHLRPSGAERLETEGPLLGAGAEAGYASAGVALAPGESLVLLAGLEVASGECGQSDWCTSELAQMLLGHAHLPAEQMVSSVARWLDRGSSETKPSQGAMLVVQRTV